MPKARKVSETLRGPAAGAKAVSTVPMSKVAAELAHKTGMTNRDAASALDEFAGLLVKHLKKGNKVRITGLGVLTAVRSTKGKVSFRVGDTLAVALGGEEAAPNDSPKQIVKRVEELIGDRNRAKAWFDYEPLPAFGNKTPRALVAEGRADAVQLHLDTLEDGVYA